MLPEHIQHRIVESIDGTLDAAGRAELEEYLAQHPEAAELLDELRRGDEVLETIRSFDDPSADRLEAMVDSITSAGGSSASDRPTVRILTMPRWMQIAAAAVLILIPLVWWWTRDPSTPVDSNGDSETMAEGIPEFLRDPELIRHFDVIRELGSIEELGEQLDVEPEETLYDMVSLQLIGMVEEAGP